MKNQRESNRADLMLDAVLVDEHWHALNDSLKREALAALGVEKRKRCLQLWMGRTACATILLVGLGWWFRPLALKPEFVLQRSQQPAPRGGEEQFISEEAMLAMFPRGSCVVAEVNGQKELVFFDAQKAAEGFVLSQR